MVLSSFDKERKTVSLGQFCSIFRLIQTDFELKALKKDEEEWKRKKTKSIKLTAKIKWKEESFIKSTNSLQEDYQVR